MAQLMRNYFSAGGFDPRFPKRAFILSHLQAVQMITNTQKGTVVKICGTPASSAVPMAYNHSSMPDTFKAIIAHFFTPILN